MVARDHEQRLPERAQVARRLLVLVAPPAVGEVAADDHELRLHMLHERPNSLLERRIVEPVARAEMEIRHVQDGR